MRSTITIVADVPSVQRLTALRQKCHEYVDAEDDVSVIASNSGLDHPEFTVFGAHKGKPDDTYRKVVRAADKAAAQKTVTDEDPSATVVAVFAGDVQEA